MARFVRRGMAGIEPATPESKRYYRTRFRLGQLRQGGSVQHNITYIITARFNNARCVVEEYHALLIIIARFNNARLTRRGGRGGASWRRG